MFGYIPYEERSPDSQYRELLIKIMKSGVDVLPKQDEKARMVFGHQMRFDLKNGFPIIIERDLVSARPGRTSFFFKALGELIGFLHGARTVLDLEQFGNNWWGRWASIEKCHKRGLAPGDLGPGSYGAAWRHFPTAEGKPFDQITHLVEPIKELPNLRTHFLSPWIPQYVGRGEGKSQKVVVVPCHGWVHVMVNIEKKTLSVHHFQRSADVPVGLPANIIQYAALTLMLAQVAGYAPGELVYTLSDAHIYHSQFPYVEKLLATESGKFPTVTLDSSVTNLFDFRQGHFEVSDYEPKMPFWAIPTPV